MNKHVFVTGVGRGIGRAIALNLVHAGYQVSGCARSHSELLATRAESGQKIEIKALDVTSYDAVRDWVLEEIERVGPVQPWGLVCAAGIYGPIGPFLENSLEDFKRAIDVNLLGTLHPIKALATELVRRKLPGRILCLSGGGATQPIPNFSSYCAAKSAVVRFAETLALELRDKKITVNSIAPGAIATKFVDDVLAAGPHKAGAAMYEKALKLKEVGGESTDRVASLFQYLLSEESNAISGRLISAIWDPWEQMHSDVAKLQNAEIYTLRRIVPESPSVPN